MTLDQAQDRFRSTPTAATATEYLRVVLEYWNDGMVGSTTLSEALNEVKLSLAGQELVTNWDYGKSIEDEDESPLTTEEANDEHWNS